MSRFSFSNFLEEIFGIWVSYFGGRENPTKCRVKFSSNRLPGFVIYLDALCFVAAQGPKILCLAS